MAGLLFAFAQYLGSLRKIWSDDQGCEADAVRAIATRLDVPIEEAQRIFDLAEDFEHADEIEAAFVKAFGPRR